MRIFILFDLPVTTKIERREASKFRTFLISQGFTMIQFSIYVRICNGLDAVAKYENRVRMNLPGQGNVRMLTITEKQYEKMKFLVGEPTSSENKVKSDQLTLF